MFEKLLKYYIHIELLFFFFTLHQQQQQTSEEVYIHHRVLWMAFGHPNGCTKCHPTLALQGASIGCALHSAEAGWQGQTIHRMVGLEALGGKKPPGRRT
jgi:hypothetical protein